jgi:long-subunit fatty acid transport protein
MEDSSLGGAVFTGPTHGHASSFFVNPAALGLTGRGWHLHIGGSGRLSSLWIDRQQVAPDQSLEPGPSASSHTISPGGIVAWYGSFREGAARFGLSLFTPSVERFPSGEPAIGYHSLGGELVQGMLTMAASHRFGGRFYVGLGVSLGYSSLRLKFNRDTAPAGGSDDVSGTASDCGGSPCGYENPDARETYEVSVGTQAALQELISLKNVSASFGAMLRLPRNHGWIGFGYFALPGAFSALTLSGDATVTRSPREGGEQASASAEIGFRMAQMAYLGYRRPVLGTFDLVTDLRWQDWSRHNQFDIRLFGGNLGPDTPEWMLRHRGLHDVFRVSLGLESDDQQKYRYGARFRFETSAADDNRITPIQVAGSNLTLATGTELHLADRWIVSLGYEISWFPEIGVNDSAFDSRRQVACVDSRFDFDQCDAAREGRAISTAAGTYNRLQHGLVLSLRYDFL